LESPAKNVGVTNWRILCQFGIFVMLRGSILVISIFI